MRAQRKCVQDKKQADDEIARRVRVRPSYSYTHQPIDKGLDVFLIRCTQKLQFIIALLLDGGEV